MKRLFSVLAVLALAAVFVVAGVLKAGNPAALAETMRNYRLVPWPLVVAGAWILPWLEIVAGAGLLWSRTRRGALVLALGMLIVFLAVLISAWARGLNIDCGCFGVGVTGRGIPEALAQDVALLTAAIWLAWSLANEKDTSVPAVPAGV